MIYSCYKVNLTHRYFCVTLIVTGLKMLTEGSHQKILTRFLANKKPDLMKVDSLPLGTIAAEVASHWHIDVNAYYFYDRDVAEAVSKFTELSEHERNQLEWAILDNVCAYCAWIPEHKRTPRNAEYWAMYRPDYLTPIRYFDPQHHFNIKQLVQQNTRQNEHKQQMETQEASAV